MNIKIIDLMEQSGVTFGTSGERGLSDYMTDHIDGVRINIENTEVVHLRPSGNAPEFRCYNEAGSQRRVKEMNKACINILEGMRRQGE